jgi:spectinomycin phosphotransferase
VRSLPAELASASLWESLADGWGLRPASTAYVPEGGGSYHWRVADQQGRAYFVTVDDLDDKDWMADTREAVFDGLARALRVSAALRHDAGLAFVLAPIAARAGDLLRRIDGRYTVSVFPFLAGHAQRFGPYADAGLRDRVLDLLIALHRATPAVRAWAPPHAPRFAGRGDLEAFLAEPDRPWDGGPYSEPARQALAPYADALTRLVAGFDRLIARTARSREHVVITHGEPHPGNIMTVGEDLYLIDWDTAALAPPERDLSLLVGAPDDGPARSQDRYQQATGRAVDPDAVTLYRLRWYLDDTASAVRMFRNAHQETADTRRWLAGLEPQLAGLSAWLRALGE